jgi:8-oxo-dGTP pyrophosphatase MutT (NUDIX family)
MSSVPVRDAATVALLRDGPAGVETWLLNRVPQMAFAAGVSVFPGGRVEPADADLPWSGRSARDLAARFGCEEVLARALVGAAVRETFEETGVLLTSPPGDLGDVSPDVESGRLGFGDLLRAHGLAVDADAVRPWARWITPDGEVRRYDTRFFVAALPEGATAIDLTSESLTAEWVSVADALVPSVRSDRLLMPPTAHTLRAISGFGRVADVLAAADARDLGAVRPVLRRRDDGWSVELPDGDVLPLPTRSP